MTEKKKEKRVEELFKKMLKRMSIFTGIDNGNKDTGVNKDGARKIP